MSGLVVVWDLNSGLLQEQYVLLITEPSLQSIVAFFPMAFLLVGKILRKVCDFSLLLFECPKEPNGPQTSAQNSVIMNFKWVMHMHTSLTN